VGDITTQEKTSPFSPGRPVSPEMFVGRQEQIARLMRSAGQVAMGKQENIFVTGEFGIGKSSLVGYVRLAAEQKYKLAGFHVLLGGVGTLEGFVQQVVDRILQEAQRANILDKLRGFFSKYIESVELFGVKVNVDAIRADAPQIAHQFLPFLRGIWYQLRSNEFRGLALFLDDLNGIARVPAFAALIKSLVDEIALSGEPLPLYLVLSGVPQRRMEIIENVESVQRIFDIVEVSPLQRAEVEDFFQRVFASAHVRVEPEALLLMVDFSGGLPKLMHEIGDAVFWKDRDNRIDVNDAQLGIMQAADTVGRKYFDPIRTVLQSDDYHAILDKLARLGGMEVDFTKSQLEEKLSESERKKLNNFLRRMKGLHALSPGDVRGEYKFPNRLVRFYLSLESSRQTHKH
jgi:hypothetical protein